MPTAITTTKVIETVTTVVEEIKPKVESPSPKIDFFGTEDVVQADNIPELYPRADDIEPQEQQMELPEPDAKNDKSLDLLGGIEAAVHLEGNDSDDGGELFKDELAALEQEFN